MDNQQYTYKYTGVRLSLQQRKDKHIVLKGWLRRSASRLRIAQGVVWRHGDGSQTLTAHREMRIRVSTNTRTFAVISRSKTSNNSNHRSHTLRKKRKGRRCKSKLPIIYTFSIVCRAHRAWPVDRSLLEFLFLREIRGHLYKAAGVACEFLLQDGKRE